MLLNLNALVTRQDEQAIIDDVEAGEDHIKAKFEDAIRDAADFSAVRSIIEEAYVSIKEGHDEMRDLKHSMERRSTDRQRGFAAPAASFA